VSGKSLPCGAWLQAPRFLQRDRKGAPDADATARELARFVEAAIRAAGYRGKGISGTRTGWLVTMRDPAHRVTVFVYVDVSIEGAAPEFHVWIYPSRPVRRRWLVLTRDIAAGVRRLSATVFGALAGVDGITVLDEEGVDFE